MRLRLGGPGHTRKLNSCSVRRTGLAYVVTRTETMPRVETTSSNRAGRNRPAHSTRQWLRTHSAATATLSSRDRTVRRISRRSCRRSGRGVAALGAAVGRGAEVIPT